jgi:hypothetical protein
VSTDRKLTVHQLSVLGLLAEAVEQGRKIARQVDSADGEPEWGIARAFTREGGTHFLTSADDVRDGFIWVSGGNRFTERWWPVAGLLEQFERGEVSLDWRA